MTVRVSKFPSVQLEDRQRKRYERSQQPEIQKELCDNLFMENIINMDNIKKWNPEKIRPRWEKYRTEYLRRVRHVLFFELNKWNNLVKNV